MNARIWSVWCGVGAIAETHEKICNLTKTEAIKVAFEKSKKWPRVLVIKHGSKNPHGAVVAGIEYGRISGRIFDEMPKKLFAEISEI